MAGVILGTAAYMSPEQAKGKRADKSSDIWAFGCVLYEMLTGKRAFEGEDVSDTLAAVLRADADWLALPAETPLPIVTLLKRCLEKDGHRRIAEIAVAQFVLGEHASLTTTKAPGFDNEHRAQSRTRALRILAAAVVAAVVTAGIAWLIRSRSAPAAPIVRFSFTLGEQDTFSGTSRQMVAISPDGTQIVYIANNRLYRRPVGELASHAIPGTEGDFNVTSPVFSPDGQWIAYHGSSASDSAIRRMPLLGGSPTTILRIADTAGMSWGERGLVYSDGRAGIFRVSPNGGQADQLVRLDDEHRAYGPQLLPGGESVLFTLVSAPRGAPFSAGTDTQIVVQSLATRERLTLVEGASDARYLASGYLVFAVSGSLFAVRFDPVTRKTLGDRVPILPGVRRGNIIAATQFAISNTGSLVYLPGPVDARATPRVLSVSDRRGTTSTLKLPPGNYAHPRVSPDGERLAVEIDDSQGANISIYDLAETAAIRRLTLQGQNRYPVWSHDGQRVAFESIRQGERGIFWQRADGQGSAERLTTAAQDVGHAPESFSPDGKYLLFTELKNRTYTLYLLSMVDKKIAAFGDVTSSEPPGAVFSPEGRWVAYASTAPTTALYSFDRGIFIQPFPATGVIFQVPKARIDYHPAWAPDGKSLYYVSAAPRPLAVVDVRTEPNVSFGSPSDVSLSVPRPALLSGNRRGYDILRDGRILTISPAADQDPTGFTLRKEVCVVINWDEELKRLVAAN
jgi:serine/threonine-protein kinase